FTRRDSERLRHTHGGSFVLPPNNPGIRIEPHFASPDECALLAETAEAAAAAYGYGYDGDATAHVMQADGEIVSSAAMVNNVRVTGRRERDGGVQRLPPWGYGETFFEPSLPPPLAGLAARVRYFCPYLGPLRDVTINGARMPFLHVIPTDLRPLPPPPALHPDLPLVLPPYSSPPHEHSHQPSLHLPPSTLPQPLSSIPKLPA
ncbi:MAG: hypothetical protein SGPRY_012550, partial [Prymnesium sp.]